MAKGIPNLIEGRLVTFLAGDGLVLHGFLAEKGRPGRCIVYVHGMSGNFYHSVLAKVLARKASKAGYSTFMMNTRGHDWMARGSAFSGRKIKRVTIGTAVERFEDCVRDIDGALRFLKKRGYSEFVLAGHSTGCQKILYYQYKRKARGVKALIHLAPEDDYNLNKRDLKKRWDRLVRKSRALSRSGKGYRYTASCRSRQEGFSP